MDGASSIERSKTKKSAGSVRVATSGKAAHNVARAVADIGTAELSFELLRRIRESAIISGRDQRYLGNLWADLGHRCRSHGNRFSPDGAVVGLRNLLLHPDYTDTVLSGATCLELGCGASNPLAALMLLLLGGADRGIGIDLEQVASEDIPAAVQGLLGVANKAWAGAYPLLKASRGDIDRRIAGFDTIKLDAGDPTGIPSERLEFRSISATETELYANSVDFLYSNSFLEHVPAPDDVAREMARVVRDGGFAYHQIDGTDHRHYANGDLHPLEFLSETSSEPILFGCNRIRPADFSPIFEKHGFEVRKTMVNRRIELDEARIASFVPEFREKPKETLEVVGMKFFLRRRR